ncbi:MAG: glycoside hydrolase family 2 TIM barrel-domain containing protein [Candidatus Limiplasma sp.]|nr:glycoside hydrolase family 2 TIM barrel-domain containing protein [Candidatus Limiplasma sp.]
MKTPWGEALDPSRVLQEYPRPQLRRERYLNLNGLWRYAITGEDTPPQSFQGDILVPFCPESGLSGVGRTLGPRETLWYQRQVELPPGFVPPGGRLLAHFGAVDQEAVVWVNGQEAARHLGGYTAFWADITQEVMGGLREAPEDEARPLTFSLLVRVHDDTDASWHSRGKQSSKPGGIWYGPQSGIWQTVWLEAVPERYITGLKIVSRAQEKEVTLTVQANGSGSCRFAMEGLALELPVNEAVTFPISQPRLWSPEDPYLYDFSVTFGQDKVESYFGLRDTQIRTDAKGVKRLFLNGKPYFHNGLLDQGYWSDGLYTAPSDEALVFDIQTAKDMGFTLLRKHIKVESARWYYHCDRLGMLVWQDMPNGGGKYRFRVISTPLITRRHLKDRHYRAFARQDPQGRAEYRAELTEMVTQLGNAPSVVLWVPFNEGWGQFDAQAVCRELQALDPSRPVDHASGWHDQRIGEMKSWHIYFIPYRFKPDRLGRAVVLSEFGGYNLRLPDHCAGSVDYGYKRLASPQALWEAYEKLYTGQILPAIPQGLAAAVYTQLSDVEGELNGLITYDRKVVKLPVEKVRALNKRLMEAVPEA